MNAFVVKRGTRKCLSTHYFNGRIESELYIKNDFLAMFKWHPNGNLMNHGCYFRGHRHGEWIFYHENGVKSFQCTFDKGKFDGFIYEYYATGKLRSEGYYVKGEKSFIREWTPSGNLLEEYFDTKTNGMFRFHQKGILKIEGSIQKEIYYAL